MKYLIIVCMLLSIACSAQVRMNYSGDTLKGNVKKVTEHRYVWRDTITLAYAYDEIRKVASECFYRGDVLKGTWIAKYDNSGRVLETVLYSDSNKLCSKQSCKYDRQGMKTEVLHADCGYPRCYQLVDMLDGSMSNWPMGEMTYCNTIDQYEYNSLGLVAKMRKKVFEGSDTVLENVTDYVYNSNGALIEMRDSAFERYGNTTPKVKTYRYDSAGNKTEEELYSNANSTDLSNWYNGGKSMTHKILYKYDSHNNRVDQKEYYFGSNSPRTKPHSGTEVGGGTLYTFETLDNMVSTTDYRIYREDNGSETLVYEPSQKVAKREESEERDSYGNTIKRMDNGRVVSVREIAYY